MSSPSFPSSLTPRPLPPSISVEKLVRLTHILPLRLDPSLTPTYARNRESQKINLKINGTTKLVTHKADTQRVLNRPSLDSVKRKDHFLCIPTNAPTATDSTVLPASPPFHPPCDPFGMKTRSQRSSNTTRVCSGSSRGGGKDSTAIARNATPTKKSNSD